MNELDEIKQKKIQQMLQKKQQESQEQAVLQQQINQLEQAVKSIFTKEAMVRYGNLKMAHPDKAVKVLIVIANAMQNGRISQVDDEKLKTLLIKLEPDKKEFTLRR